jgi:hypothetical protein
MKTEVTRKITLTVDELKKILINHLNMKISDEMVTVKHRIKSVALPSANPHDCFWDDVFDGLTITVKETLDD